MERHDGVLELTFHSDGDSLAWGSVPHNEFGQAFTDIGRDPENKVVIMAGTGELWSGPRASAGTRVRTGAADWDHVLRQGMRLTMSLLEIDAIVISAVHGPALRHAEIPLLADIVLAAPEASFQDSAHFANRMVPGDGVNFVFPLLLGFNRARYFLLTGQELSAQQAHELGLVAEILPREQLLPRARELAAQIRQQNDLVLRYTRLLLVQELKRTALDVLGFGLALEGLGVIDEANR
jgi:enoyl-CoA hydratase/carnithine racemase